MFLNMEKNTEELLQFLYLSPIGLIETDKEGNINLCNAMACNYLMVTSQSTQLNNLFTLLNQGKVGIGDEYKKSINSFEKSEGIIFNNKKVDFSSKNKDSFLILSFLIRKIKKNKYMWAIQDITEITKLNEEREKLIEKESFQSGRVKLMENIIHDIGNTLANLHLGVKTIKDTQTLGPSNNVEQLLNLFKNHKESLGQVFKEKNDDLFSFLETFSLTLKDDHDKNHKKLSSLEKKVSQMEQIIQSYRKELKNKPLLMEQNNYINETLKEALNLTENQREIIGIETKMELSKDSPFIHNHSTSFFQTFLNILNNSYDSLNERKKGEHHNNKLEIRISSFWNSDKSLFFLSFEDNGVGFSEKEDNSFFIKGKSKKDDHEGLGLYNIKINIEKLGGKVVLNSPGKNLGATLILSLPKIIR